MICGFMTWGLLIFGMYASTIKVIVPWLGYSFWGMFHIVLFNFLSILGMYSHLAVMLTDPGAVPKDSCPLEDDVQEIDFRAANMEGGVDSYNAQMNRQRTASRAHIPVTVKKYRKFCKRCKAFKPIRAHHCSICGRCIIKMDHHCPWVNNCVGIGNQKLFLHFLMWVNVTCIYSLVLVVSKFVMCSHHRSTIVDFDGGSVTHLENPQDPSSEVITSSTLHVRSNEGDSGCNSTGDNLLVVFLVIEAILFGLFTLCMLGDQSTVLTSNQTQIDKLKGYRHEGIPDFNEVFGGSNEAFRLDWLVPTPVMIPEGAKERLLGYRIAPEGQELTTKGPSSKTREEAGMVQASRDREVSIGIDKENDTESRRRHSAMRSQSNES